MKNLFFHLLALIVGVNLHAQTVGVGTTTPNANSVLDIFSNNKGVLIPRLLDTTTVATPTEGLIIYNRNTKSPYYYNGSRWVALGTMPTSTATNLNKITYKVLATGFTSTEQEVFAVSHGISRPVPPPTSGGGTASRVQFGDFSFTKVMDINSVKFTESISKGTVLAEVEFKFYAAGASIPYVSYKFREVIISGYDISASSGGGPIVENISINFIKYGVRDWVNNKEFGFDVAAQGQIAY